MAPALPLPEEVGQDRLHVGAGSRVPTQEPRDRSPDRNQARDRDQRDPVAEVDKQLNEAAAVDDLVVAVVAAAAQVRMMDSNHYRDRPSATANGEKEQSTRDIRFDARAHS